MGDAVKQGAFEWTRRLWPVTAPLTGRFDGPAYNPALDQARLEGQMRRVFDLMRDGVWRTLPEMHAATGDPEASLSAQLRHLRKARFGGYDVQKGRRGLPEAGLWEYRLVIENGGTATF